MHLINQINQYKFHRIQRISSLSRSVVLLDELHVLFEGDSAAVVLIDLAEVPVNHLVGDLDLQRSESVFHQSSKLCLVNQIVFIAFLVLILH